MVHETRRAQELQCMLIHTHEHKQAHEQRVGIPKEPTTALAILSPQHPNLRRTRLKGQMPLRKVYSDSIAVGVCGNEWNICARVHVC